MKTRSLISGILLATAALARAATNDLTATLQKGLFEEEANHNFDAAIQAYQAVVNQFDKDRKLAATAVFRLAECYRKQGATNEAIAQYARVLREFYDQTPLVTLTRTYLTAAGKTPQPEASAADAASRDEVPEVEAAEVKQIQAIIRDSPDLINAKDESAAHKSRLHDASSSGRLATATFLLENGVDIEAKDSSGQTPLHYAAVAGHKAMVDLLLSRHANSEAADYARQRPLHLAAEKGFRSIVEALVEHGADVNAKNQFQATPLHLAAVNGFKSVAEFLLGHGADVNASASKIVDSNRSINRGNGVSGTALHIAAERGDLSFGEMLLARGADVNANAPQVPNLNPNPAFAGGTPLHIATVRGNEAFVKLLLANKADPNSKRPDGLTPILLTLDPHLLTVLLEGGANIDARDPNSGETALIRAARSKNKEAFDVLLARRIDLNERDNEGNSALHWLVFSFGYAGSPEAIPVMAESLLAAGANPNLQNDQGKTPIQCIQIPPPGQATGSAQTQLAAMLRKHGALENPPDFSSIRVTRAGLAEPIRVFRSDTNGINQFTLAEVLLNSPPVMVTYPDQAPGYPGRASGGLPFPDLSRITTYRYSKRNPTDRKEIIMNMLNSTNGIDCTKDMPLEFGDEVEIPEREHTLAEPVVGLTEIQRSELRACLKRKVTFRIKGQSIEVKLFGEAGSTWLANALRLSQVQSVLRSSSDFSRIHIHRVDPVSAVVRDFVLSEQPGSPNPGPIGMTLPRPALPGPGTTVGDDLWLRDGDAIEIPDKP